MKKIIVILPFLVLAVLYVNAQQSPRQPAVLWGESGDGKNLKLIWFLKQWEPQWTGFDVKRRQAGSNTWQTLNPGTIVPAITTSKNYENVEPDAQERVRLQQKTAQLLSQKSLKSLSPEAYAGFLTSDTNSVRSVAFAIALDYDYALINGFGLVDRSAAPGNRYEYGLFAVPADGTPPLLATFTWQYGTTPNLDNMAADLQFERVTQPNAVQLKWSADTGRLNSVKAVGFHVYKQVGQTWQQVSTAPVKARPPHGDYVFTDASQQPGQPARYAVAPQTMFGNLSAKTEAQYNPAAIPASYIAPELDSVQTVGSNFDEGFLLQWTFPQQQQQFIQGFVVEKANLPANYQPVSAVLPASSRSFTDTSFSPPASYVQFRVKAVYKNNQQYAGNHKLVYYLPVVYAPKPTNLSGQWLKRGDSAFVRLTWNPAAPNDTITEGYRLFASNRFDGKMYLQGSLPLITANSITYPVYNQQAQEYRFAVAAVSRYNTVGRFSDTITVRAPSQSLPIPVIYPYSLDTARRVILQWTYATVPDLKGFRIYQNGNMVASEYQLTPGSNRFVTPPLRLGSTYLFTLQAVTQSGLESEQSIARDIYIYQKTEK